jgi:hypothetical protein
MLRFFQKRILRERDSLLHFLGAQNPSAGMRDRAFCVEASAEVTMFKISLMVLGRTAKSTPSSIGKLKTHCLLA